MISGHDDLHFEGAALLESLEHRVDAVVLPVLIRSLGGRLWQSEERNAHSNI